MRSGLPLLSRLTGRMGRRDEWRDPLGLASRRAPREASRACSLDKFSGIKCLMHWQHALFFEKFYFCR